MYLAIEGVIGVGKTTLARLLQPAFDAELLLDIFLTLRLFRYILKTSLPCPNRKENQCYVEFRQTRLSDRQSAHGRWADERG